MENTPDISDIDTTNTISHKAPNFLKQVGNAFIQAQEANARRYVKKYMSKSYRPF